MSQLFNHADVVVASLDRSLPFYRELLRRLGHAGLKLEVVHQPQSRFAGAIR
jgi:hypothetical protein